MSAGQRDTNPMPPDRAALTFADGSDAFVVSSDKPFVIGRGETVDLRIEIALVSRRHASIEFSARCSDGESQWLVEDCESRAGTFLNGRRVKLSPLSDGDLISIGGLVLEFCAHP